MDVEAEIKRLLVTDLFVQVPEQHIGADASLRDVLGLDSLGFLELRVQCENRFGVTIDTDDFTQDNFATVGRLAGLVHRLRAASLVTGA
ncbi:acyl carrier protein [Dactylosporangium sp. NPDC051485]|uniref:acyl carrier protein n=1 Tax=Dactylosporangium sp. NPDC051485 TaxID=3154846 RepID=UPI00341F2BCD